MTSNMPNTEEGKAKQCGRKRRYAKAGAKLSAKKRRINGTIYKCPQCGWWHVTSIRKCDKNKKQEN